MRISELIKIKNQLQSNYTPEDQWKKNTGLTSIILLFTEFDDKNAGQEIDADTLNCLTLAAKLDNKNVNNLTMASNIILKDVNKLLSNTEQNYIATLDDAIALLRDDKFNIVPSSDKNHVQRVFSAIKQIHENPQDIPNNIVKIDVPEGNEIFQFYFHGENYKDVAARKEALMRLNAALINIWNDAVDNKQLAFFLQNIQAGPCVEGATREAMSKLVESIEKKTLPTDFDTAMAMYFAQASSLLAKLNLPQSLMNIHDLIIATHAGESCVPKLNTPSIINSISVKAYLKTLGFYDTKYRVEREDAEKCKIELADKLKNIR